MTTTCELETTYELDDAEGGAEHHHGDWYVSKGVVAIHVTRDQLKQLCAALTNLHADDSPSAVELRLGMSSGEGSEIGSRVHAASVFLWE